MTVQVICQALLQSIAKLLKLGKSDIKRVRGDLLPALKLDAVLLRVNQEEAIRISKKWGE